MSQLKLIYFFPELRVPSSKLKDIIVKKKEENISCIELVYWTVHINIMELKSTIDQT